MFCTHCGSKMNIYEEQDGFSAKTGEKVYRTTAECPLYETEEKIIEGNFSNYIFNLLNLHDKKLLN